MAKFAGVVRWNPLEGGFWQLACDDGRTLTLANPDKGLMQDGRQVVVQGDLDEDAVGIGMVGPMLVVRSYQ